MEPGNIVKITNLRKECLENPCNCTGNLGIILYTIGKMGARVQFINNNKKASCAFYLEEIEILTIDSISQYSLETL
jgi:hypothetical protein